MVTVKEGGYLPPEENPMESFTDLELLQIAKRKFNELSEATIAHNKVVVLHFLDTLERRLAESDR